MTRVIANSRRRRIKKWLRHACIAGGLLAAAALAVPFVFTSALVRYAIDQSPYHGLPLQFKGASLSPWGALTIRNVQIADTGTQGGKPLIAAGAIRLEFNWRQLWAKHVRMIAIDDLDLTLRPGGDLPLSLQRLLSAPAPASTTVAATSPAMPVAPSGPAAPAADAAWSFDQLLIVGHLRGEQFEPWLAAAQLHAGQTVPVQLAASSKEVSAGWAYAASLTVGDVDSTAGPSLKARFNIRNAAGITTINADQITLQNLQPEFTAALIDKCPSLPADLRRPAIGSLGQLTLSGAATCGKDISLNASVELHNLSAHLQQADAATPPVIENLSASLRVAGKLTATPLKDLTFTDPHCTWDTLQYAGIRFTKGVADFDVAAPEIVLKDLQATWLDTPLTATGAYDTDGGLISRGRVWLNNFSAPQVAARLPESLRRYLPAGALDGTLSARVFLSESTHDHVAAHVELASDDQLRYFRMPPAKPPTADSVPDMALQHFNLSGTLSWNYRRDTPPEISHGRMIADDFLIYTATPNVSIDVNSIKADFTFASGIARVVDFYADLAGEAGGSLEAEATYALASRSLESASVSVKGADAALFNPWLSQALSGQFSFDLQAKGTTQAADAELTAALSPEASIEITGAAPGSLMLESADGMSLHLLAHYDGDSGTLKLEQTQLASVGKMQVDAGFVAWLRRQCAPGGAAAGRLDAAKDGGSVALDKVTFDGTIALGDRGSAAGKLAIEGLAAHLAGDPSAMDLQQLAASAVVSIPFAPAGQNDLRITEGQFRAKSLAFSDKPLTNLSGQFAVDAGTATASNIQLTFDEGAISGDGALTTEGRLDTLHMKFQGVNQQLLTESLFPTLFTAQGAISGALSLDRAAGKLLAGSLTLTGDAPGRLKVSRDVSSQTFAPAAKAAASNAGGALLPDDFDQIVINQLADYPYQDGAASLQDDGKGLSITLNYNRVPLTKGEPGYATTVTVAGQKIPANLEFNLRGMSLTVDSSLPELLKLTVGLRDQLARPQQK